MKREEAYCTCLALICILPFAFGSSALNGSYTLTKRGAGVAQS